jgi:exonuclease SbcC
MRIHSLTLEGFGPFKEKQVIDFDKLSADKLFMLEGPTGSGKSSIIDAIVFALYGDTAQQGAGKAANAARTKSETDRMSQHRIRSDYCSINDTTEVVLEFSNGNGRYRVRRVPALPRLKRDGTEDLSNQEAQLIFVRPEALPVTGPREVNLRIKEVVGLDEKQFNQLIVLPQGKFTTFLFADRNSREAVLTDIFRTFFYDELSQELTKRKKAFEEDIKEQESELQHHVRNLEAIDKPELGKDWNALLLTLKNQSEVRSAQDALIEGLTGDMYVDAESREEELNQAIDNEKLLNTNKSDFEREIKDIETLKGLISKLEKLTEKDSKIKDKEAELKVITAIEPLLSIIQDYESAEKEQKRLERTVEKDYRQMSSVDIKAKIPKLRDSLTSLEKELSKNEDLEEKIEDIEERIQDAKDIETSKKALEKAKKQLPSLESKLEKAKKALAAYKKNRSVAGASILARGLKPNQPCPVCGSKEHPSKAKGNGYDEDHELELESQRDLAKESLDDCKSDIKSLTTIAKKKLPNLKELEDKLALFEKKLESVESKVKERDTLKAKVEELDAAFEALQEYENQKKQVDALLKQLAPHLKKYQVDTPAGLKQLAKPSSDLKAEIERHNNEKVTLKGLIAQDQYKDLRDLDTVKALLAECNESLSKVKLLISEITGLKATARGRNETIDKAREGLFKALDVLESLRNEGMNLINLESVVGGGGQNKHGLTLKRYVLQEKLELILERASGILYQISGGKYEFKLQEEKIKGQLGKSGLGITVMDLYAGKERPAETLSGGEAFYSSLALALGLAEVIRADRGGLELGTLFIDEGFGSLDEDKLDEVLEVIEKLGASNRIIGVISHVESMKSRIPARLEVRSTPEGPSILKMVGV